MCVWLPRCNLDSSTTLNSYQECAKDQEERTLMRISREIIKRDDVTRETGYSNKVKGAETWFAMALGNKVAEIILYLKTPTATEKGWFFF